MYQNGARKRRIENALVARHGETERLAAIIEAAQNDPQDPAASPPSTKRPKKEESVPRNRGAAKRRGAAASVDWEPPVKRPTPDVVPARHGKKAATPTAQFNPAFKRALFLYTTKQHKQQLQQPVEIVEEGSDDEIITGKKDYSETSCFKNGVCTVTSNLCINTVQFTNVFGGQLTDKLPGNRLVIRIGNQRYTLITYSSGKIILTNYFYLIDNSLVYMLFVHLIILIYALGIGTISDDSEDGRLRVLFLVENCIFSFQIAPQFFNNRFTTLGALQDTCASGNLPFRTTYDGIRAFHNFLRARLEADGLEISDSLFCKHDNFPSDLIKFSVRRIDFLNLQNYKSSASKKRNNNNFVNQHLAILVFRNGKMIVTGMQSREDLETTFKILFAIVGFFFV